MEKEMTTIIGVCTAIKEYFTVKIIPAVFVPLFGFMFGFNSILILKALLFLVVFDFITGLFAAYKSGDHIESKKAVRSAFKVAIYGILISAGHLTGKVALGTDFIEQIITTFLALTELISIIENIGKVGYAIPKKLLNKLEMWRDQEKIT